jgi:hypothetical protein
MSSSDSRMHILQMIEDGKITAEEGMRLLNAVSGNRPAEPDASTAAEAISPDLGETARAGEASPPPGVGEMASASKVSAPPDPQLNYWKRWWMLPMFVGLAVTIAGGLLMYWAVQSSGVGFWFLCSWVPLLIGLAVTAVAWASRTSRWVHIRVERAGGERPKRIAISLPIPLKVVAWVLRMFGARIRNLNNTAVDEILLALNESATPDEPIFIDVTDGEKGERVQVYFG